MLSAPLILEKTNKSSYKICKKYAKKPYKSMHF